MLTHAPAQTKFTDRVPLGTRTFFLKFGKLPSVMDSDQQFPDEQSRQAQEQDGSCDWQKHHQNVWTLGAVWMAGGRDKGMSSIDARGDDKPEVGPKEVWFQKGVSSLSRPSLIWMLLLMQLNSSAKCYDFPDTGVYHCHTENSNIATCHAGTHKALNPVARFLIAWRSNAREQGQHNNDEQRAMGL